MKIALTVILLIGLPLIMFLWGQAAHTNGLVNDSGSINFTGSTSVRPAKHASSNPGTCTVGEKLFNTTDAKFYSCLTTNTWTEEGSGSGSGASSTSGLTDFSVTQSGQVLTIGIGCTSAAPCRVRFGSVVYSFTPGPTGATATLSGAATGTAYIYISSSGALTVGHNLTIACSSCTQTSGVTAFPTDSIPLYSWTATTGAWTAGTPMQAFISAKNVSAGTGMTASESSGTTTLAVDTTASFVTEAMLSTSDVTTANATTSKHGLLKKLDNVATNCMNGQGNWVACGGGGIVGWTHGFTTLNTGTDFFTFPGFAGFDSGTPYSGFPTPVACTASKLYIRVPANVNAGGTIVFTLRNVTTSTNTALTVTVAAGSAAGVYSDTSNSVALTAGNVYTLKVDNNSTATNSGGWGFSFLCN